MDSPDDVTLAQQALTVAKALPGAFPPEVITAIGVAIPGLPVLVEIFQRLRAGESVEAVIAAKRADLGAWDAELLGDK